MYPYSLKMSTNQTNSTSQKWWGWEDLNSRHSGVTAPEHLHPTRGGRFFVLGFWSPTSYLARPHPQPRTSDFRVAYLEFPRLSIARPSVTAANVISVEMKRARCGFFVRGLREVFDRIRLSRVNTLNTRHYDVTAKLLSSARRSIIYEGESHGAQTLWRHRG